MRWTKDSLSPNGTGCMDTHRCQGKFMVAVTAGLHTVLGMLPWWFLLSHLCSAHPHPQREFRPTDTFSLPHGNLSTAFLLFAPLSLLTLRYVWSYPFSSLASYAMDTTHSFLLGCRVVSNLPPASKSPFILHMFKSHMKKEPTPPSPHLLNLNPLSQA